MPMMFARTQNLPVTVERQVSHATTSKTVYLPGLNGLRAIAALAVVISHITLGLGEFGLNNKIFGTDMDGNASGLLLAGYGVTIFFTLSGFLITFLLLKEKEVAGHLRVKDFYIRRMLRIWPLYYLYFVICIATILGYGISFSEGSIPFYVFLAANIPFIVNETLPFLAHYWSLGVEEQFYLFFPQLAKQSNKRLLKVAVVLIFVLLFVKFIFWVLYRQYGMELPFLALSVTRFHTMLIGVVGAILYYHKHRRFLSLATHKVTQIIAWTSIFLIAINKFHIFSVIDQELISVVALFLIMGQITKTNSLINLENKTCDFIGKISYGIYVIHPILIFYFARLLGHFPDTIPSYLLLYFLIIFSTIFLAYLSYEFYEKKFLKAKRKYTIVKSSNTRNNS
jgi:peptidoglycan/LPS O-acetylase OafA/YrhL